MKKAMIWSVILALLAAVFAAPCVSAGPEDTIRAVWELALPYYRDAAEVARNSPGYGRNFTDHKTAHAEMVAVKAVEAGHAIGEAARRGTLPTEAPADRVAFSAEIDYLTLEGAAIFHDTGMCGNGYAMTELLDYHGDALLDGNGQIILQRRGDNLYMMHMEDNLDFEEVRTYHSMNSGLYVLVNREALRDAGYTDIQIDKMAAACMAHSKSNSGVKDLNSRAAWRECFLRLESVVTAWNEDHENRTISFDRTPFETDSALLSALATETLALRVGDVSRDSGPDAEVQTGETVHVDRDTLDDRADIIALELENAAVFIVETNEAVISLKSRQVHAGEQNITENHTILDDAGMVTHVITVRDGCSAPRCTQEAVDDHLGEFGSAPDGQFIVRVIFTEFADEDDFFRLSWEDLRLQAAQEYPGIEIQYPWDEEAEE